MVQCPFSVSPVFIILLLANCTSTYPSSEKSLAPLSDFFDVSEACPHTCFMGINPGVTTLKEVIPLLTVSDQFSYPSFREEEYDIIAKWFKTASSKASKASGWVNVNIDHQDNIVRSIRFTGANPYTVKEFIDLSGEPDEISISLQEPADARYINYALYYTKLNIILYPTAVGFGGPKPDDKVNNDLYINMPIDDEHVQFWIIDDYNNRQPWLGYGHIEEYLPGVILPSP